MGGPAQGNLPTENVVVVAVKAEKEISKAPLAWALAHIIRPGDFVTLLAVIGSHKEQRKWLWSFPRLNSEKTTIRGSSPEDRRKCDASASCSQMALQFHGFDGPSEVNMRIKVVVAGEIAAPPGGAVAAESVSIGANWIVLDRQLKQEVKRCMEELPHCSVVLMKRSQAKVLRLNLGGAAPLRNPRKPLPAFTRAAVNSSLSPSVALPPPRRGADGEEEDDDEDDKTKLRRIKHSTPASSTEEDDSIVSFMREYRASTPASSSTATGGSSSPFLCEQNPLYESLRSVVLSSKRSARSPRREDLFAREEEAFMDYRGGEWMCSICRHRAPEMGKRPRWFSYAELEEATESFSEANFVAEGGFGWVHRGILSDGRVVAVKTLKTLGGHKGEVDFRAEAEILGRAQHRNVVLLLGFCAEGPRRVLVYEYVCNGSLSIHLHGRSMPPLEWSARFKIAVGSARGLRYLHEDCRVGLIHRDFRPNNVLLTHDFEPMVGDFGLGRWQMQGNGVDTRVIGTFGYLAPEYIESGVITEKADVYAYGVVLLELITGRRAMDMSRPKGQQFLTEWARPALALPLTVDRIVDPQLDPDEIRRFALEVNAVAVAASLCLRRDPLARPSMSQVLRVLEGENTVDMGFRAGRYGSPMRNNRPNIGGPRGSHSQRIPQEAAAKALVEGNTQPAEFF